MRVGGGIEVTDAWLVLPPERDRRVVVAAARAMHRRAAEFASCSDALRAMGVILNERRADGVVADVALDESDVDEEKAFKVLAVGADADSMLIIFDTRGRTRNVYRVDFDGAGHFRLEYLVFLGGEPHWAP
jgi:hypothetical protein